MDDSYNEFPLSSLTFQGVYGLQKMVCDCKELSFTTNMALPCSQGKYFDREFCTELGLKKKFLIFHMGCRLKYQFGYFKIIILL